MSILGWLLTSRFRVRPGLIVCRFITEHILSGDVHPCSRDLVTVSNICQSNRGSYEIEVLELNGYRKKMVMKNWANAFQHAWLNNKRSL